MPTSYLTGTDRMNGSIKTLHAKVSKVYFERMRINSSYYLEVATKAETSWRTVRRTMENFDEFRRLNFETAAKISKEMGFDITKVAGSAS